MIEISPASTALVALGTFVVSLCVAAIGPTGGLQLAIVASVVPQPLIIPLHACISSISALFRALALWRHIAWRYVLMFAVVSLAASLLAVQLALRVDERVLEILVGVTVALSAFNIRGRDHNALPRVAGAPTVAAAATGFSTVFIGATGPLLFALMSVHFSDRERLMGTHSACLFLQHVSKLVLFGTVGIAILDYPLLLGATTLASAIGTWLGSRLLLKIPDTSYHRILAALMLVSGTFVVVRAVLR